MKKVLLLGTGLLAAITAVAQAPVTTVLDDFYSTKISPDGSVIASQLEESCSIYFTKTKNRIDTEFFYLGNGNCFSENGSILVGADQDLNPYYFYNGEKQDLSALTEKYQSLNFDGVTSDGTRVVGSCLNPSEEPNETMYVPIYCDIDAEGKVGEPVFLPYPVKDFSGRDPQRVLASCVSKDGKMILGQYVDYSGMAIYPIIFTCGEDNKWSYYLPTENLINPNKLTLPEWPGEWDEPEPDYAEFMSPEQAAAYNAAMDAWEANGYVDTMPEITEYMTPDELAKYTEAIQEYMGKIEEYNERTDAFFETFEQIINESTFFLQNAFAMNNEGTKISLNAVKVVDNDDPMSWMPFKSLYPTYLYDVKTKELTLVPDLENGDYPLGRQILTDGTLIATTTASQMPPTSYVLAAGAEKYVPFMDFYATVSKEGADWLKENFKKTIEDEYYDWDTEEFIPVEYDLMLDGLVNVSDDWSVVTGGVMAYFYSEDHMYESYLIIGEPNSVGAVATDAVPVKKTFYNLQGVEIKEPASGLYIEKTTFTDGSSKAATKVK